MTWANLDAVNAAHYRSDRNKRAALHADAAAAWAEYSALIDAGASRAQIASALEIAQDATRQAQEASIEMKDGMIFVPRDEECDAT